MIGLAAARIINFRPRGIGRLLVSRMIAYHRPSGDPESPDIEEHGQYPDQILSVALGPKLATVAACPCCLKRDVGTDSLFVSRRCGSSVAEVSMPLIITPREMLIARLLHLW